MRTSPHPEPGQGERTASEYAWPYPQGGFACCESGSHGPPAIAVAVASMVSQTFQVDRFQRGFAILISNVAMLGGIVLLLIGDDGGQAILAVLLLFVGGNGLFLFRFWAPNRVTLDDSGVLLEAVARRVHIPWDELESLEPAPWGFRRQALRWRRSRGRTITTLNAFPELQRMLVEIEQQAPHVAVSS